MSVPALDGAAADDGFVLRGAELDAARAAFAHARSEERWRRIRNLVTIGGGWVFGLSWCLFGCFCLALLWKRPVPHNRLGVFVEHVGGWFEPMVMREDLPADRADVLMRWTVRRYVAARASYTWEGVRAQYKIVSALSAPEEQARYQGMMRDASNPDNPMKIYGDGVGAGKASVVAVEVQPADPAAPNQVHALFILQIDMPNKPPVRETRMAELNWEPAADTVPLDVQERDDPAGILFTHWSDIAVPGTQK